MILHTRVYKRLCDKIGKFVHHMPERPDPESRDPEATGGSAARTPVTEGGYVDTVGESQSERARGRR
ncbi:hypothetical protein ACFW95_15285 [Streptomyces sp. NPDC059474]|uniref:hypothetical protein n=1 Tax=Streptomyces sp. NPDC059474 TaxID=3346846 RepID=UPI0036835403